LKMLWHGPASGLYAGLVMPGEQVPPAGVEPAHMV
jgi:hypothetical protein